MAGRCKAFITGSRAYGTPHEGSDVDLVILVTYEALAELIKHADEVTDKEIPPSNPMTTSGASLRFGVLNIIAVTHQDLFDVWATGTDFLKAKAPVTRERAVAYLKKKRDKLKSK